MVLCAITFFPGLDRHGVTNWQEAQRLVVARQMQDRLRSAWASGDSVGVREALLVPTSNGTPYLAKPPMIYWSQIAIAEALGERVALWHLRLVVALAGTLGVLATYWATIQILSPDRESAGTHVYLGPNLGLGGVPLSDAWVRRAAFWAGATLCTGVLYARSARIGELDILLVPFCTLAIGAIARAWRAHRERRDTDFVAVAIALLATVLAVLTKDPGVMVVGLAAYAGIALWAATRESGERMDVALIRGRRRAALEPLPRLSRIVQGVQTAFACACGVAAGALAARNLTGAGDALGVGLIAGAAAGVGWLLARMCEPLRFRAFFVALSRTHPVGVIGGAVAVRLAWGWAAGDIIGTDRLAQLTQFEVEDNVRLFMPEAPLNNLEASAFGVGVASVMAIVGLIWLLRDRPRIPAGWWTLFAWLAFVLLAFSVLGKGVQRYLTPMWPAIAILAGLTIASLLARDTIARWLRPLLYVAVVALAIGQGAWYGFGREAISADRSPRDLVREVVAARGGVLGRMMSIEFSHPALEYYLDRRVVPVGDPRVNISMAGGRAVTFDELAQAVRFRGPVYAFIRTGAAPGSDATVPIALARLELLGLHAELVPTHASFRIDAGRSEVKCYRLSWRGSDPANP